MEEERKIQLEFWIGGLRVIDEQQYFGYGGQTDVILKLGNKIALGGLANLQSIEQERLTPMVGYFRVNIKRSIALQGGYGWYMEDFDYDFNLASNGYYGGLILVGRKVAFEISGYFPDNY